MSPKKKYPYRRFNYKKKKNTDNNNNSSNNNNNSKNDKRASSSSVQTHNVSSIGKATSMTVQLPITSFIDVTQQPARYRGWSLYFSDINKDDDPTYLSACKRFENYFKRLRQLFNFREIEQQQFFTVDYKQLLLDQEFLPNESMWADLFVDENETLMRVMGLAMHQCVTDERDERDRQGALEAKYQAIPLITIPIIYARLINYTPIVHLKDVKAKFHQKFVSIQGVVVRVGNCRHLCTRMAFECGKCRHVFGVTCPDGKYTVPERCLTVGCTSQVFEPQRSSHLTTIIDWQIIRIQEVASEATREPGRIPRTIDCELTNDLVHSAIPGDIIQVQGVVKLADDDSARKNTDQCLLTAYIDVNSVVNQRAVQNINGFDSNLTLNFTLIDLYAVEQIRCQLNLYKLLVQSLCPGIYGHEIVKAGLLLGLFGGRTKSDDSSGKIPIRGDPHILIVGDPGLGKSQLLHSCVNVAPRGIYVCGTSTTTAGLTITLHKDTGGDMVLDAGALVLSHQGCCCIDEFDKMSTQQQVLLEVMEQQCVSIAKAGIIASVPARTCVLACANPVGGHYDKSKTVAENLKMKGPILSRFDLVFILIDRPNDELDFRLSEHVLAMHNRSTSNVSRTSSQISCQKQSKDSGTQQDAPLIERLRLKQGETLDFVPHILLQKYIAYARRYVHPKLLPEAIAVLKTFYLELRSAHQHEGTTPITLRQLESLIRLTEARAKLELRDKCTELDAKEVVQIMKASMFDTYSDENGCLDFSRLQHGSGMSKASQVKKFAYAVQRVAEMRKDPMFTVAQLKQIASDAKINIEKFDDIITKLNDNGYLLKKGLGTYKFQIID